MVQEWRVRPAARAVRPGRSGGGSGDLGRRSEREQTPDRHVAALVRHAAQALVQGREAEVVVTRQRGPALGGQLQRDLAPRVLGRSPLDQPGRDEPVHQPAGGRGGDPHAGCQLPEVGPAVPVEDGQGTQLDHRHVTDPVGGGQRDPHHHPSGVDQLLVRRAAGHRTSLRACVRGRTPRT